MHVGQPPPLTTLRFGVGQRIEGQTGQVVAVATHEVVRGRENVLTVSVPNPRTMNGVALRGTIRVPHGYEGLEETWVGWLYGDMLNRKTKNRRGFLKLAGGFPRVGNLTSDPLPEGRWVLRLEPVGCRFAIEVKPGMAPLALEVPPAVRVKLEVGCADTGEPISGAWVRHIPRSDARVPNSTWKYAAPGTKAGVYWSVCREGLVAFDAGARGYCHQDQETTVTAGDTRLVEFRLQPAGAFRISLRCRGMQVPVEGMHLRHAPKERPHQDTISVCQGHEDVCGGLAAGIRIVKPGKLPGFLKPEPKEVEVRVGQVTPIVFDLQREDP